MTEIIGNYDETHVNGGTFLNDILTGDIIFTTGQLLSSNIIRFGTNGHWSHVGIAIWLYDGKIVPAYGQEHILHIFDVDKGYEMDVVTLGAVKSCRVAPFRYSIPTCLRIGYRRLRCQYNPEFYLRLHAFILEVCNGKRQINKIKSLTPWIGLNIYADNYQSQGKYMHLPTTMHCSELVAIYLHQVVIPSQQLNLQLDKKPALYCPNDYADDSMRAYFSSDTITIYCATANLLPVYAAVGIYFLAALLFILVLYLIFSLIITKGIY